MSRLLQYNRAKARKLIEACLTDQSMDNVRGVIENLQEMGRLPSRSVSIESILSSVEKYLVGPVSAGADVPHPYRQIDYLQGSLYCMVQLADAFPVIMTGAILGYSLDDIELMCAEIYQTNLYPQFSDFVDEFGMGSLFTLLSPQLIALQSAPIFHFDASACEEVSCLDIQKGIDTTYLRSPAKNCYFDLASSNGALVSDSESGLHELDGFYVSEQESSAFSMPAPLLKELGVKPDEPYRVLSLVFVGKPKKSLSDDTLAKIDLFLQDGLSVDFLIERYISWYMGELVWDASCTQDLSKVPFDNIAPDGNIDIKNNVLLIREAINYLCYLNLADFRREQLNHRTLALKSARRKAPKKQAKAMAAVKGKTDRIVIKSKLPLFDSNSISIDSGYKKSPHFRRGFIRNQRYGSGDDVHYKPKYIPPTLVAQRNEESSVTSKTYAIKG